MNRTEEEIAADYIQFRGKCKELCEAAINDDPTLTLVRGHYVCPFWGEQAHFWTVRADGTVFDPSCRQFPSNGHGIYIPFSGKVNCAECGKELLESEASFDSRYAFCSGECHGRFVGVL